MNNVFITIITYSFVYIFFDEFNSKFKFKIFMKVY